MILLGSQVGTPAISPAGSNFDTMRALKSMPLRYCASFLNWLLKAPIRYMHVENLAFWIELLDRVLLQVGELLSDLTFEKGL